MIAELLQNGKQNKVTFAYLKKMTGCKSERKLRKMIAEERKQGAIILSCAEGGYYLPSSREEVESYVKTMNKEARAILFSLKHCRQYLKATENAEQGVVRV